MTAHAAPAGHTAHAHGPNHVDPRPQLPETAEALTQDVVAKVKGSRFGALFAISGILFVIGIVGVFMRISGGYADRSQWGFYAATWAWLASTACAAPMLSVATRFTKGYWRKPLVRFAELFTVSTVLLFLMFIPLIPALPPTWTHVSMWVNMDLGMRVSFLLAPFGLMVCGLGLLITSARADRATVADQTTGRQGMAAWLGGQWGGTPHQWKVMRQGITYLSAFYFMFLVFVHFMSSIEMAITLVPGWRDPIFPAFHGITALQAGLATLIITLGIMRKFGGFKNYLALDQFWNPGKLLMAFSMLWFYFWWCAFIIFWYGRTPAEQGVLLTTAFGPYLVPFVLAFVLNFAGPLFMLIWNPIRVSIPGPIVASVLIVIGNLFDRWRIYGGSFGVVDTGKVEHVVQKLPVFRAPDAPDLMVLVGVIGGVVFLYLLAMKIFPQMAIWELTEGQLLTKHKSIVKSHVVVIGKPD